MILKAKNSGKFNIKINMIDFNIKKNYFEFFFWNKSKLICGVDEAGRGSLVGPVVAGAVVLKPWLDSDLLKDSKILTEKSRDKAFQWIKTNCLYAFAMADVFEIEQKNIAVATKLAMMRVCFKIFMQLKNRVGQLECVITDAVKLDFTGSPNGFSEEFKVLSFNKCESISSSVAAASIVAKVVRDSIITQMDQSFPAYLLHKHKGYGTAQHIEKISELGASIVHRKLFVTTALKNFEDKIARQF